MFVLVPLVFPLSLAGIPQNFDSFKSGLDQNTGKSWDYWIQTLKKAGADSLSHKEIVQLLKTKYKLKPWWQQIIAGGFEVYIGRRNEGENAKGEYTVTVTKTLPAHQKNVWKFITSPEGLTEWLNPMDTFKIAKGNSFEVAGGIFGEVRTFKAPKHIRLRWEDSEWPKKTVVQIHIIARPKNKCMFGLTHENLANPRIRERQRAYWKEAVERLSLAIKVKFE